MFTAMCTLHLKKHLIAKGRLHPFKPVNVHVAPQNKIYRILPVQNACVKLTFSFSS